jgi:N-acetylglucosamine malate deacetylase 1
VQTDILAIGVHPDDVELSCGGTLLKHIAAGYTVGIIDLTRGELGTRGTPELRLEEANNAAKILGVQFRENLGMADGFFVNDKEHQFKLIEKIRQYRPRIVICNAIHDRHSDHGRASQLVTDACFYSGLRKIETGYEHTIQEPWRPVAVYHYIQDRMLQADIIVDVSEFTEKKMEAIRAFGSQFYREGSAEPPTPISSRDFMEVVTARMRVWGRAIGAEYGEGFIVERTPGVSDLLQLL